MQNFENFREYIEFLRNEKGLKLNFFVKELGVVNNTYYAKINEPLKLTIKDISKMAEILNIPTIEILTKFVEIEKIK